VQGAKWDPVSLAELGFEGSREDAAVAALTGLSRRYATWQRSGMASVLRAFRARDGLAGRRVVVRVDGEEREISGEAAGIDLQGRLLVAEGRAVRALPAAEVVQVLR
jgi:biotin-(acetyl-CoA carboxylase) ligase